MDTYAHIITYTHPYMHTHGQGGRVVCRRGGFAACCVVGVQMHAQMAGIAGENCDGSGEHQQRGNKTKQTAAVAEGLRHGMGFVPA